MLNILYNLEKQDNQQIISTKSLKENPLFIAYKLFS